MSVDSPLLIAKLDALSKDIELLRTEAKTDRSSVTEKAPWYSKILGALGIPAAMFALLLQYGQFNSNKVSDEKIQAEAAKIRTERFSVQIDIEKKIQDLQKARSIGGDNADLQKAISGLRSALDDAAKLRDAETKNLVSNIITKFIIVWFLFQAWAVIGGILSIVWSTVVNPMFLLLNRSSLSRSRPFLRSLILPTAIVFLNLFPNFVIWYGQFSILLNAAKPVAYDAAAIIGREKEFAQLQTSLQHGSLTHAYSQLLLLFTAKAN